MSEDQGRALVNAGVAALDVGGAGGTSFALVEAERAADRNLDRYHRLGQVLGDWGLPTAVSVVQCSGLGVPVIATGVCAVDSTRRRRWPWARDWWGSPARCWAPHWKGMPRWAVTWRSYWTRFASCCFLLALERHRTC